MAFENQKKFITIEDRLMVQVMGLPEREALSSIEREGRIGFVEKRDKQFFEPKSPTAHSYRIKLTVKNGKVINTSVG